MVARLTAGLAKSTGSLPSGLWLTSPACWLPRTGISSGTLRSVIEQGLPLTFTYFVTNSVHVGRPLCRIAMSRVMGTFLPPKSVLVSMASQTPFVPTSPSTIFWICHWLQLTDTSALSALPACRTLGHLTLTLTLTAVLLTLTVNPNFYYFCTNIRQRKCAENYDEWHDKFVF